MGIGKTKKLLKSVSELRYADYSGEPELKDIYQRLTDGRNQFAEILEKNIKARQRKSHFDRRRSFPLAGYLWFSVGAKRRRSL